MHAIAAAGISSEGVKKEFRAHADEEREHMHSVAERINQLGGTPDFDPKGLETRAASFGNDDPTTRRMLEGILSVEEEHTNDMHDLLVAHHGKPMLED